MAIYRSKAFAAPAWVVISLEQESEIRLGLVSPGSTGQANGRFGWRG